MNDIDIRMVSLLEEIRDYLRLMAEPALAERDRIKREKLKEIVGKSQKRQEVVLSFDGIKSRAQIQKELGMDQGNMSRFVSELKASGIVLEEGGKPRLLIPVDSLFFQD
jgi:CRP-like cAMP-binding protein